MVYDLKLAWQNILSRPVQTIVTALVLGLAIALSVTVTQLNDGLERGIVQASDAFGVLVVGAKGSAQQLVISSILLQGNPVGNIPITVFEELQRDNRVVSAIPIAMGDNVGGARIVGTDQSFFQLAAAVNAAPAFQLEQGRLFREGFETVLGSRAAEQLGLAIGDSFLTQHGVERGLQSDMHNIPHTIVGILQPSNSPYDGAVFTTIDSVINVHSPTSFGGSSLALNVNQTKQITAVLVSPIGFREMNQIWQDFYTGTVAQAAFPGKELGGLFNLFNQGQKILISVGYLAAVMAGLTLFLAVYSASAAREHFIAIMRSVGAGRLSVFRMVIFEAVLLALIGSISGRIIGWFASWLVAQQITNQSAIPIPIRYLPELELYLWVIPVALSIIAGILPAVQAYRINIAEKLFDS